ncbi:MAG: B3/4 domain-containing protein [Clostridia bacterium]|nr:B3/4 domain-containing protein [Clostridia bacterium]
MKVIVDKSMAQLGITDVVYAVGRNLDPHAELTDSLKEEIRVAGEDVVAGKYDELLTGEVIEGYKELVKKVGRSVKKNAPTVAGFIDNIKHRGGMPHINSIVDIYNLESLRSAIATGGHDLDKVKGDVIVTVSGMEDSFTAIGGSQKHVEPTDFIYRDDNGILAYLDVRDSELYKMSDDTRNVFFVMQGNENTSVEYRLEAMKRIEADLRQVNPEMEFEISIASAD